MVGVLDDWPHQRRQWIKEKVNSTVVDEPGEWLNMVAVSINRVAANKPVAKDSSVLATCVIHAEVGQQGQHLGTGWSNEMELKVGAVKSREGGKLQERTL